MYRYKYANFSLRSKIKDGISYIRDRAKSDTLLTKSALIDLGNRTKKTGNKVVSGGLALRPKNIKEAAINKLNNVGRKLKGLNYIYLAGSYVDTYLKEIPEVLAALKKSGIKPHLKALREVAKDAKKMYNNEPNPKILFAKPDSRKDLSSDPNYKTVTVEPNIVNKEPYLNKKRRNKLLIGGGVATTGVGTLGMGYYLHKKNKNKRNTVVN